MQSERGERTKVAIDGVRVRHVGRKAGLQGLVYHSLGLFLWKDKWEERKKNYFSSFFPSFFWRETKREELKNFLPNSSEKLDGRCLMTRASRDVVRWRSSELVAPLASAGARCARWSELIVLAGELARRWRARPSVTR